MMAEVFYQNTEVYRVVLYLESKSPCNKCSAVAEMGDRWPQLTWAEN